MKTEIPIIEAKIDTSEIEKAVNLSNELIDNLKTMKHLSTELHGIVDKIEYNIKFSEKQEDT